MKSLDRMVVRVRFGEILFGLVNHQVTQSILARNCDVDECARLKDRQL